MIRALAPDELEWFLSLSYSFLAHSDPRLFAHKSMALLRDPHQEALNAYIYLQDGQPVAGAYVLPPLPDHDDQNLYVSNLWFSHRPEDLSKLLKELLRRHPHDGVRCPLYNVPAAQQERLQPALSALGWRSVKVHTLEFELAEVPPLGRPVVLEAWTEERDPFFQEVYANSEGNTPSEAYWGWLKRLRGEFIPGLWFIAAETLDQDPVGYAFFGHLAEGIDGSYYLSAAGVLQAYRGSSEMLRRLLLSCLWEIAAYSPLGRVEALLPESDPKLIDILVSIGFRGTQTCTYYFLRPA